MIDKLLSFVAPHLCCGCGKLGNLLCDNCKDDINNEPENVCLACEKPCGAAGVCSTCRVPYSRAWCVGQRKDALQRLIGNFKFERAKVAYRKLGDLLLLTVPELPSDTVVVPVPTVRKHVRVRGYDHTVLIARYFAKRRGLKFAQPLIRATDTMQRQSSASLRREQAKLAFVVAEGKIIKDVPYLLIDDVKTTGATIKYAAKSLKDAGAVQVWVAVIARQTLD